MDSKQVQIGMLVVGMFAVTILVIVLAVNGVFGSSNSSVENNVADEAQEVITQGNADYSAWMSDETFFDKKELAEGRYETKVEKAATFKVSTIGRNIRVVVLDEEGNAITGRKFSVDISDGEKYRDDDRDGIISIEDVSPGEYSVAIGNMVGYALPEKPIKVTVKAKIEYKAVADISYLIKTEADIDAEKEDTAQNDAAEESEGSTAIKTVENALFGIDVSKYNGDINWRDVKDEGVKFAIIRCGYRGSKTGAIVVDPYFEKNMEGAAEAGIPVGVYFFTQALDESEAIEEASAVMSLIKKYKVEYPVFIDSESAGGKGRADDLDAATRSKVLQAFCETIRSGKYTAGVYASKNWFKNRLDISKLSADNVTWLAQYADEVTYEGTYQMWQYSSAGRIAGIEGRVDMNLSYLDIDGNRYEKKDENLETEEEKAKVDKDDKNSADLDNAEENKESNEDGQVDSRDM